jgi:flavin reductase (DIM6/NTAB) family NADH-FMN oxidoreductase RutF
MTVDPRRFREALGAFATGVTVVTAPGPAGGAVGLTVTALASVSLVPPLILVCLDNDTADLERYSQGDAFAVNFLAEDQTSVSELFASQDPDKFAKVAHRITGAGCILLSGCIASLECRRIATFDGGDHRIVVGRVEDLHTRDGAPPLLRFRGRYAGLGPTLD